MRKNVRKALLLFCCCLCVIAAGSLFAEQHSSEEAVQIVSEKTLIPGGQSVGIRMDVRGVLVVGLEEIETTSGTSSPGYEAGIQIGDMIVAIDGQEVYYADEVISMIDAARRPILISVSRKGQLLDFTVTPVREYQSGAYRMGIWVKEKIAGIGTLSFYDPETDVLAALGHGIYESKTGALLSVGSGQLLTTAVSSIREGEAGKPGEIRGIFYGEDSPVGQVAENSEFGVYSIALDTASLDLGEPMVMAYQSQVREGPASILTTIDGRNVEEFSVEITDVNRQKEAGSKGLTLKVTDERLLSYCGGIIQGMSGSPIIQNDKLVGAVTHVFVNDPTRGYGIFAEWMVEKGREIAQ